MSYLVWLIVILLDYKSGLIALIVYLTLRSILKEWIPGTRNSSEISGVEVVSRHGLGIPNRLS